MGFKDQITSDIGVFLNSDEFAETVQIDGEPKQVVIDEDRLLKRAATEYEGISAGLILYFIPASSFPSKPSIGSTQLFNGRLMFVDDVKSNVGVYEILLNQNRSE